jgi:hypothetical protein
MPGDVCEVAVMPVWRSHTPRFSDRLLPCGRMASARIVGMALCSYCHGRWQANLVWSPEADETLRNRYRAFAHLVEERDGRRPAGKKPHLRFAATVEAGL